MNALDRAQLRERVQKALGAFLAEQRPRLDAIAEDLDPVAEAVGEFLLDGGKRMRPAFCYWGWRGAGGGDTDEIVAAASCLELLQACALAHDDVMDDSDTRRGRPALHRRFASLHRAEGWHGDPDAFGRAAAILLGNLCLIWADQLLNESGLPREAIARAASTYDLMRVEVMAGQYLDVLEQAQRGRDIERVLRIARFKAAKYTVERPLHLGGVLAGAAPGVLQAYSGYGLPLGEAFQLRDDVLGVYGDPAQTGKPAGDDLREGKRTALVTIALNRATPEQAVLLNAKVGDPQLDEAGVCRLRAVVEETGALAEVESMIARLTEAALAALDRAPVEAEALGVLRELAYAATERRV